MVKLQHYLSKKNLILLFIWLTIKKLFTSLAHTVLLRHSKITSCIENSLQHCLR
jgi:hypothetical protein